MRIETRGGRLVYDIRTHSPDGERVRERRSVPDGITSPSAAKRWGEKRQAFLVHGQPEEIEVVPAPTLEEFGKRWLREYAKAEGLKPSTQATYERNYRLHLVPHVGQKRLDQIGAPEVQKLKLALASKGAKTRACILALLDEMLRAAVKWGEITTRPEIDKPRWMDPEMEFYDFGEWERLVEGAGKAGPMPLAAVLLGGEAGLRRGELIAFERTDFGVGSLLVMRSEWEGHTGTPKGGKTRRVPLTPRLEEALTAVRHLRGKRLLWRGEDRVTITTLASWLETACRRAGLPESRNVHKLRHTFGAHLAMRGAPAKAIQELMGHADLKTTMRYMHLAAGSKEAAIALLIPAGERAGSKILGG